mmetsp:Transcript_37483/g.42521  ORF Transcript_37483/g.42521 Transcript_37483/m.42521 type:complete len:156 (+) Transcript_37483:61-528(+)
MVSTQSLPFIVPKEVTVMATNNIQSINEIVQDKVKKMLFLQSYLKHRYASKIHQPNEEYRSSQSDCGENPNINRYQAILKVVKLEAKDFVEMVAQRCLSDSSTKLELFRRNYAAKKIQKSYKHRLEAIVQQLEMINAQNEEIMMRTVPRLRSFTT